MKNISLTIDGQRGEPLGRTGKLEVLRAGGSRERSGLLDGGLGNRYDGGTVDEVCAVMPEDSELGEGCFEARGHELLLVDEALPEAGCALIAGKDEVGLETELASVGTLALEEGRGDFSSVVEGSGEASTLEQDLEEDLSVESEGSL